VVRLISPVKEYLFEATEAYNYITRSLGVCYQESIGASPGTYVCPQLLRLLSPNIFPDFQNSVPWESFHSQRTATAPSCCQTIVWAAHPLEKYEEQN